jgi:hypothetical protein
VIDRYREHLHRSGLIEQLRRDRLTEPRVRDLVCVAFALPSSQSSESEIRARSWANPTVRRGATTT